LTVHRQVIGPGLGERDGSFRPREKPKSEAAYLRNCERPSVPGLNALAYRIFEVLLPTGADLGTDVRSPVMASL
jgi:hypothetical protein